MGKPRHVALRIAVSIVLGACVEPPPPVAPPPVSALAPPLLVRDTDRDGVNDAYDACPALPGMISTVIVRNGCPPPSYYDDGLGKAEPPPPPMAVDPLEVCRSAPTPEAALAASCPRAWLEPDQIRILGGVGFGSGSTHLLASSHPVLAAVADVMSAHPEILRLTIEGHTDNRGGPVLNRVLSKHRAESVVLWLGGHGVARERLQAAGIGFDRPLASNETEEGRAENRRVEFRIVAAGAPLVPPAGTRAAGPAPAPPVPGPPTTTFPPLP